MPEQKRKFKSKALQGVYDKYSGDDREKIQESKTSTPTHRSPMIFAVCVNRRVLRSES